MIAKICNKILGNQVRQCIEKVNHHGSSVWIFNVWISIIVFHHINRSKMKTHMICLIDAKRSIWQNLTQISYKVKHIYTTDSAIPLLAATQEKLKHMSTQRLVCKCYSNFIHSSKKLETIQLSINRGMDKQIEVYSYNWNYSAIIKMTFNNMDGLGGYYAKWNVRQRKTNTVWYHLHVESKKI